MTSVGALEADTARLTGVLKTSLSTSHFSACLHLRLWAGSCPHPLPHLDHLGEAGFSGLLQDFVGCSPRSAWGGKAWGWSGCGPSLSQLRANCRLWALPPTVARDSNLSPFCVRTKGGKEAANYLSNLQITFLRHGRQMLGAFRSRFNIRCRHL